MIAAASIQQSSASLEEPLKLDSDEERTAVGLHISFPAGLYRAIYRTNCGTVYRAEHPVRVNGVPWEHAGLLLTNDGVHAFQFNENQVLLEVLDRPLNLICG